MGVISALVTKNSKQARYIVKWDQNGRRRKVLSDLSKEVSKAKRQGRAYITGWKKVRHPDLWSSFIAELRIPVKASMRCPRNDKCRASRVKVVGIYAYVGGYGKNVTRKLVERRDDLICTPYNKSGRPTRYQVGQWVRPEESFDRSNNECASGIHFFLTAERAIRWT